MSYATKNDLIAWCGINGEAELTQLTDPNNQGVDDVLITAKLGQADDEINGRLIAVDLPLTAPYPPLLVSIACRIARHLLYTSGRPDYIEADYRDALKLLGDIREGRAALGLNGAGTGSVELASDAVEWRADDRVFTREALDGY
jgi:phage gp36-like protein